MIDSICPNVHGVWTTLGKVIPTSRVHWIWAMKTIKNFLTQINIAVNSVLRGHCFKELPAFLTATVSHPINSVYHKMLLYENESFLNLVAR